MTTAWEKGAPGVLLLPSGRLVRGRGLRRPPPPGQAATFGLYLLGVQPPPVDWPSRWIRWPDFRLPADRCDTAAALREAWDRAADGRVEIACGGGRGRTGTALACLAVPSEQTLRLVTRLIAVSHRAGHDADMKIQPRYVGAALGVGALTLTVVLHRGPLLHPGDVLHALAIADRWWLFLAAAAQFASLAAFGEQQRYLLRKFGGTMSLGRSIAVTLARTSISLSVPGGPAVSTAYAIRQFRSRGASSGAAAAVTVLAGLQGLGALLLVYLAWFSTVGLAAGHSSGLRTAAIAAGVLLGAVLGLRWLRSRTHIGGRIRALASRWRWSTAVVNVATGAVRHAASLSARDWAAGGLAALANWLLDVACLVATARAFGLEVGVVQVVGAYLAIQLVRQIPLTPGGVGVVEASLLVALVALGATSGTAAAVVLIYRLLSTWLLVPIGLLAWAGLRPGQHRDVEDVLRRAALTRLESVSRRRPPGPRSAG